MFWHLQNCQIIDKFTSFVCKIIYNLFNFKNIGRGGNKSGKPIPKNRINLGKQLVSVSEENEDVKTGIREILLRLEPLVKVSGGNAPLDSMMVIFSYFVKWI